MCESFLIAATLPLELLEASIGRCGFERARARLWVLDLLGSAAWLGWFD